VNTYIVTFVAEPDDTELELATQHVTVESDAPVEEVAAGEYDVHELVVGQARGQAALDGSWEAVYITMPDGELATTPAGL
jgi:hypothetical protein